MTAAQPPRGMRDVGPDDMRRKDYVCAVLRQVFEEFAFEPLDTPALEYRTTLMGKYGPDAERLFAAIESSLRAYPLCQHARVEIRRGPPGAPAREVRLP